MKNRNKYMYEKRNPGKLYEDYLEEKKKLQIEIDKRKNEETEKKLQLEEKRRIASELKEAGMRECSVCKEIKSLQLFMPQEHKRRYMCRACFNLKKNNRPGLKNRNFKQRLKKNYGISKEEYFSILEKQENRCAICDKDISEKRHLDHCHTTGKVRGLLCPSCNWGLGKFKDSTELIEKAINYLEKYND